LVYNADRMLDSKTVNTRSAVTESDDSDPQFTTCKTRALYAARPTRPVTNRVFRQSRRCRNYSGTERAGTETAHERTGRY
jgi:hypothetical protein